ncbi:MAG: PQQ-binding-like beta-propeller repeat protein [Gemmataceae bacterium]
MTPAAREAARKWRDTRSEEGAQLHADGGRVVIRRDGPPPGAGEWTHEHADAANTRVSTDRRVKAPLGLLWFGGPGHQGMLPRHGHGPVPQVAGGRLVIEGPDRLRAVDIYTGRLLWEKMLPAVGAAYDNTAHQPGANGVGSNYVTTADAVYVAHRDRCLQLDPATGRTVREIRLPPLPGEKAAPAWRALRVVDGTLIAGVGTVPPGGLLSRLARLATANPAYRRLVVLDRATGAVRWTADAQGGFWPNGVCAGGGRLYAVDRGPAIDPKIAVKGASAGRVVAFDLATGRTVWRHDRAVFGTWLSYSAKHDVLVESGLVSRDTLLGEPAGMRAFRGGDGGVLWHEKGYFGPALIHGERILKGGDAAAGSGTACELLTGRPVRVADPLTGEPVEWRWQRTYGCNTPAASEHLVLFRSGAAGFYDLCHDGGTGNLGGFRSSCTLNLIPAGGVLTAPDYTRSCTCSYQNQTSVGLIHAPDAELWTFTTARPVTTAIRRVGVNLGAPGSRKADDGTLWLEHPRAGGPSPKLAVSTVPPQPDAFRLHPAQVGGDRPAWVGASGVRGLTRLTVPLGTDARASGRYTVRLVFLEPDAVGPGERRFDVAIEGRPVLTGFDVCREAGGPRRAVARAFPGVLVTGELEVTLTPSRDSAIPAAVLSGVEVIREDGGQQ